MRCAQDGQLYNMLKLKSQARILAFYLTWLWLSILRLIILPLSVLRSLSLLLTVVITSTIIGLTTTLPARTLRFVISGVRLMVVRMTMSMLLYWSCNISINFMNFRFGNQKISFYFFCLRF